MPQEPTDPNNPNPEQAPAQPDPTPQQQPPAEPEDHSDKTIADDPLMEGLFSHLGMIVNENGDEPRKIEKVELPGDPGDNEPAEPEEPKPAEPAEPKQEEPKQPKVAKRQPAVTKDEFKKAMEDLRGSLSKPAEPPAQPQPEPKKPDTDPYEDQLLPEQREELDFARYIEGKDEKRKGYANKLLDFYKKLDAWAADEDNDADPDSEEFQDFVKANKPRLAPAERDRFYRMMIKDEATAEAKREIEERERKLNERLNAMEVKPKVENALKEFDTNTVNYAMTNASEEMKPVLEAIASEGWEKAAEEHPVQVQILQRSAADAGKLAHEYLHIVNGLSRYDEGNPYHKWMVDFVNSQGEVFAKQGGDQRMKGDKSFLPRADYHDLVQKDPAAAEKHWTFSHEDVLHMLSAYSYQSAENAIKQIQQQAEQLGFKRSEGGVSTNQGKNQPKPTEDGPQPINAPKAKSSAAPPPGGGADPNENHPGREILSDLQRITG